MLRVFLLILLMIGAAQAEPIFPPGLRIGLEPAGELKVTPGFSGLRDPDRDVSVAIGELPPAAYEDLSAAMFSQTPHGATETARELFPFHDGVGYLHVARIVENNVAMRQWLLLAMSSNSPQNFVAVLKVRVPETAAAIYPDAAIRKMLASIVFRKPPIEEQLGLIPFRLEDLAGFRIMQVTPGSVLLIDGPQDDIGRYPYAIVSVGSAPANQVEDRARFSRDLLATTPFRELTLQSADNMRINSRSGFEIRGRAKDPRGKPVSLVQWVQFSGGGFIRFLGVSSPEKWDEVFNRFRAVRDGVELR